MKDFMVFGEGESTGVHEWESKVENSYRWLGEGRKFSRHLKCWAPVGIQKAIVTDSLIGWNQKRQKPVGSKLACLGSLWCSFCLSCKGKCPYSFSVLFHLYHAENSSHFPVDTSAVIAFHSMTNILLFWVQLFLEEQRSLSNLCIEHKQFWLSILHNYNDSIH
jgi:hypothetical protein